MFSAIKAAWRESGKDNLGIIAAGISYYALLAMVPLFAVAALTYGLVADPAMVAKHVTLLSQNLPESAAELISEQIRGVSESQSATKGLGLLIALAVSLFGARNGAGAIITGLNIVFHARESRSLVRGFLFAIGLTIGGIIALALVAGSIAVTSTLAGLWGKLAGYALVALAGFGAAALLYRFGPNKITPSWSAIWPGAALFSIGWMLATLAFGIYVANFSDYNATYGSLGAVVILVTWFYLSSWLLLFGAETTSQIDETQNGAEINFTDS